MRTATRGARSKARRRDAALVLLRKKPVTQLNEQQQQELAVLEGRAQVKVVGEVPKGGKRPAREAQLTVPKLASELGIDESTARTLLAVREATGGRR